MDCNKSDCVHYKVCEEWKSLGNGNYINESNGNCDCYSSLQSVIEPRPKDESVDISKLRLMTVEECAGHTIDYAMGWKACIEWIKKGGAE